MSADFSSAMAAFQRGDVVRADRDYAALEISHPHEPMAPLMRGIIALQSGATAMALAPIARALALHPDWPDALVNLGAALERLDQVDAALAPCRHAAALASDRPEILYNYAVMCDHAGDPALAAALYRQVRHMRPAMVEAAYNEALCHLTLGNYAEGLPLFETRLNAPGRAPWRRAEPRWSPADPVGCRVLVVAEEGLGDTIQFARFLPELARRGASVTLAAPPPLEQLLRPFLRSFGGVLAGEGSAPPDRALPLLSLPLTLGWPGGDVPPPIDLGAEFRVNTRQRSGPLRLGLAWAGNPRHPRDRMRSVPLAALAPLLGLEGIEIHSVQYDLSPGDRARLAAVPLCQVHQADMVSTARLIASFDLFVSVDTSLAHLAATIGCPTHVLLARPCDWRWGPSGAHSPWYPSMRLHRQRTRGDWAPAVADLCGAIVAMLGEPA